MRALIGVRTYIPETSIGSIAACESLVRPIFDTAYAWNLPAERCGVAVFVVRDREEAKGEFIDISKADRVTGGRYPYVYVNLTYDPELFHPEEFDPLVARFALLEVYQSVVPGVLFPRPKV